MSTGNIVEDNYYHTQIKDVLHSSKELLLRGNYGFGHNGVSSQFVVWFPLEDPENYTVWDISMHGFISNCGTYSCEWGWLLCEYEYGHLFGIDIYTGEMWIIGGGGTDFNDIAWDDSTSILYGIKENKFYKIDPETGEQSFLGYCGVSLLGIAFDSDGNCFGIGSDEINNNLYEINISSFSTRLVGPLTNFSSQYYIEPEFDKDNNILYIWNGISLYICDIETCKCTFIGQIDYTFFAFIIPYGIPPSDPTITGPKSGKPNIEYEYMFKSTDPDDDPVMYIIDWGDDNKEWTKYCDSGKEISIKHNWNKKGKYIIKAKARDIHNVESFWSEFKVDIPRNRNSFQLYFEWNLERFFEHFPLLERLLSFLLL